MAAILSTLVFALVVVLIVTQKVNKTLAAGLGAIVVLSLGVFGNGAEYQIEALQEYVDLNTILFLIGMMVFMQLLEKTGLFGYLGIKILKMFGFSRTMLFITLSTITALFSAFIDNVTTILIFVPITFAIADSVGLNATPFVIAEAIASNIGGTMTIVGDPPNIMIASAAKFSFAEFAKNMVPVNILNLIVMFAVLLVIFKKELKGELNREIILKLDENALISSRRSLYLGEILLFGGILLFIFGHNLELEASTIALMLAILSLLIFERHEIEEFFKNVEWEMIFFFIFLFVIAGALDHTGVAEAVSKSLLKISKNDPTIFASLLIWIPGILSSFVGNIPLTAVMIPVINKVTFSSLNPLWYGLSLGTCLGTNLSSIGTPANFVAMSLLKKYKNVEVSFGVFFKIGLAVVLLNLLVSNIYLILFIK